MPPSGVCLCDENTIDFQGDLRDENKGYGFYSTYIEKNTILKMGIMKHVSNIDIFYKVVIFDHFVYNKDRNLANLLVEYKKNNIFISVIDHSHVFKNETIWDKNCFEIGIKENDYLDKYIMQRNNAIYQMFYQNINVDYNRLMEFAKEVQHKITDEILEQIIFNIPQEWKVSESNLRALMEYLKYRREHLPEMCQVIVDYIHSN